MTTALKFIHLATIVLWSGGLIVMPFLYWQRRSVAVGPELDRLHRFARFVFVAMASPAAVLAIGTGTALIFLQTTFLEWFSLKMVLVGGMVILHVTLALILARVFEPKERFGRLSYLGLTCGLLVLVTAIVWVVLAKPSIDSNQFATDLFTPGGLGHLLGETRIPMP